MIVGVRLVDPGVGDVRRDLPLEVLRNVLAQGHVLVVPEVGVVLGVALAVAADPGRLVLFRQRRLDGVPERLLELQVGVIHSHLQRLPERLAVLEEGV